MVIYFTDRRDRVLTTASTTLPQGNKIIDDKMTDEVASGIKTFDLTLIATDDIRAHAIVGNQIIANGSLFVIITSTFSSIDNTITLYCEDAGLDFINKICAPVTKQSKTFEGWITATLGASSASGWVYEYKNDKTKALELEYTSEQTATERLQNILESFGCEMYCTYELQNMVSVTRTIHFLYERGVDEGKQLFINQEVASINEVSSIEELATVWTCTGKDGVALSKLSGYDTATKVYNIGDKIGNTVLLHKYTVTGNNVTCDTALERWASNLDKDGKITQYKQTEYKSAANLIKYAIREMEKIVEGTISYEVSLNYIPDDVRCGDYVSILDAHDNILLSARIIRLAYSECNEIYEVELGNYVKLYGSKASLKYTEQIYSLSLTSSNSNIFDSNSISTVITATVYLNGNVITSASELPVGELKWYCNDVLIPSTDPRLSNGGFTLTLTNEALNSKTTYKCRLEVAD